MPVQPPPPPHSQSHDFISSILKQADDEIEQFLNWNLENLSLCQSKTPPPPAVKKTIKRPPLQNITVVNNRRQLSTTSAQRKPLSKRNNAENSMIDITIIGPSPGRLWASGLNIAQQLGVRHYTDLLRYQPVKFIADNSEENKRFLINARLIACGAMSSYAVDHTGRRLWSWGSNDDHALGGIFSREDDQTDSGPQIVSLPLNEEEGEEIKQLAAGCSFAAVLTDRGRLFIWGTWIVSRILRALLDNKIVADNAEKDEDTGDKFQVSREPHEQSLPFVERIACGNSHLLALTKQGRVLAMGWNGCSQVVTGASGSGATFISRPVDITAQLLPKGFRKDDCRISKVFAAANSSWCEVNVRRGLKDVYHYFAWGSNTHGQLGIGSISVDSSTTAAASKSQQRLKKSASSSTVASAASSSKKGSSSMNSIDTVIGTTHQRFAFVSTPARVKDHFYLGHRIVEIVGGLDFTGFLLGNGRLFTCGRGDFGQLGRGDAYRHVLSPTGRGKVFICSRPKQVCYQVNRQWSGHRLVADEDGKNTACVHDKRAALRARKPIKALVQVSAGSRSMMGVTIDGKLLVWGDNYSGQLGLGGTAADPSVPLYPGVYFPTTVPFKSVAECTGARVGSNHTLICAK